MATLSSFHVRLRYWFYPIGNTPAVNLLRDTRIEQDDAIQVLSLGCGDVRSILYTTWCEDIYRLNFTCCDHEAAVLARNIVLFAFLILPTSKPDYPRLWNLYYHFFIPPSDSKMLSELVCDLLHASESLDIWQSSIYGKTMTLSNVTTLIAIRAMWQRYKDVLELRGEERSSYELKIRSEAVAIRTKHIGSNMVLTGLRSVGARYIQAIEAVDSAFKKFWATGVVAGNGTDVAALREESIVNPLFAISSSPAGTFAVHYGADPLLGFHLAKALESPDLKSILSNMVSVAKEQFSRWSEAMREALASQRVRCIYHYGDALSFCQKLQWLPEVRVPLCVSQWEPGELVLCGDQIPQKFNIIDTSNLADHLGLLALLPAVVPILITKSTSVLYSESLLQAAIDVKESLYAMLLSDPTTNFLLFGMAPAGYITGVTVDMTSSNDLVSKVFAYSDRKLEKQRQNQFLIRMSWKFTASAHGDQDNHPNRRCRRLEFDHELLAEHFFGVYLKMFAREQIAHLSSLIKRQLKNPLASDAIRYTRANFAMVLALAKTHTRTDWDEIIGNIIGKISQDRSVSLGLNYLQELLLWLHVMGIYHHEYYRQPLQKLPGYQDSSPATHKRLPFLFYGPNPPLIVYLKLTVPEDRIKIILSSSADDIGTPSLHLEVTNYKKGLSSCFHSTNGYFEHEDTINEGSKSKTRRSIFRVTCAIPSAILLIGSPEEVNISLGVDPSPSTASLIKSLGISMNVFETNLADEDRVQVLSQPAESFRHSSKMSSYIAAANPDEQEPAYVEFDKETRAKELRARIHFATIEKHSKLLAAGAHVSIDRISPYLLHLKIDKLVQEIIFPYPVNGGASKLRIARKSSWVEIIAPLSPAGQPGGHDLDRFPVILAGDKVVPWGISVVHMDKSAALPNKSETDWIEPVLGLTLSAADRVANRTRADKKSQMLQLKESIHLLFAGFLRRHPIALGRQISGFRLVNAAGDCDTIIIANAVLYDASSGSIVMDAHVICFSHDRMPTMIHALNFVPHDVFISIQMSQEEEMLWKALLPALVERARGHHWNHSKKCNYLKSRKIPISLMHGQAPICTCGEGKALRTYNEMKGLESCSKFATQIALAPLAAVPYVEAIADPTTLRSFQEEHTKNEPIDLSSCDNCGTEHAELKKCSGCGLVKYCDRQCQKMAWKRHKAICFQQ